MLHMLAEVDLGKVIPIVAIACGSGIAIVAIIFSATRKMVVGKEIEQSRRELAAYVAEGSMKPEDAERIMAAGPKPHRDET